MKSFILGLLLRLAPTPVEAAYIAAVEIGRPEIAPALVAVCMRESNCTKMGAHDIDAHLSLGGYFGQVKLGNLNRECQPYVRGGWATRGAFGLSAASHWEYLPECYQPWVLDDNLISARVAALKYVRRCVGKKPKNSWCPNPKKIGSVDPEKVEWAHRFLNYTGSKA